MNKVILYQTVAVVGVLSALGSCSKVAITGRKQLNLVPDSTMNSMSLQSYQEFLGQNKVSKDAQKTELVRRVGGNISVAVEKYCKEHEMGNLVKDYKWEFNLVEDPQVNAWCMPGGKVVVYTGLLPVAKDEAGLAVVMGHEIAHAIARHGSERMSQALMVQMGGMALSQALAKSPALTKELFTQSYGAGTQYGVLLPYSRVHETEADRLGLIFMAMAGYQPQAAVDFWQRMAALKEGKSSGPEFLSTHPADEKRIANIKKLIPEAMQYYKAK
jgi:predicted Zn-dependent protease